MTTVSLKDAEGRLTELARRVEAGETVTVTRSGQPVLDLAPRRRKGGRDCGAGRRWLDAHGIEDPFPYRP